MRFLFIFMLFAFSANAANTELLENVYKTFEVEYIEPNTVPQLAIQTLKAINGVDKNLKVANDKDKLSIYYNTKTTKSFLKPQTTNAHDWAVFSNRVIKEAAKASGVIAKREFEIVDLMLENAVKNFGNKENRFYPDLSKREFKFKHAPNFASRMLDDDILYIKAKTFNDTIYSSIKDSVKENIEAKALILDLRANHGGNLKSAIDVLDLFVDGGILITTQSRGKNDDKIYQANAGDTFIAKPIFVLVDQDSASSAELVAFVLQQQGRAKIIGTQTYGKNSVQNLFIFDEGRGLALTSEHFFDPDGKTPIIKPDVCTFGMGDAKNITNLLEETKSRICNKEARESSNLEVEIAQYLLNN